MVSQPGEEETGNLLQPHFRRVSIEKVAGNYMGKTFVLQTQGYLDIPVQTIRKLHPNLSKIGIWM